jgi:hypothetical protein
MAKTHFVNCTDWVSAKYVEGCHSYMLQKMVLIELNIIVATSQSFLMPLSSSVSFSYVSSFLLLADGSIYQVLKVV